MKNLRREHLVFLALLVVLVVVFGILVARKYWTGTRPAPSVTAAKEEPYVVREVRLYFGARDNLYLAAETRELDKCPDDQSCLVQTIQALVKGPTGDLVPIMPANTVIRSITEQNGVARIDFSREFLTGHPGGSVSELFTVYGLANTLADNFPHIRQVRILVEGQAVQTLKGHVDLSRPVAADFHFVRRLDAPNDAEAASAEEIAEAASAADRNLALPPEAETVLPDGGMLLPDGEIFPPEEETSWDDPEAPVEGN